LARAVIEVILAVGIGWLITFIEGGGKKAMPPMHTFVRNAIIAACILRSAARQQRRLPRDQLSRRPLSARRTPRGAI